MSTTIKDIARAAGISHTTVSRALNDSPLIKTETKQKIKLLAKSMNYIPNLSAKGLVLEKSYNIGFFASKPIENMPTSFVYEVMDGISAVIGDPYHLIFKKLKDSNHIKTYLNSRKYDAIIFLSTDTSDTDILNELKQLKIPVVTLNRNLIEEGIPCVFTDEYSGTFTGLEQLIQAGHRTIAMIEGPDMFISSKERSQGFMDALKKHGLTAQAQYMIKGGFTPESGYDNMLQLLSLQVPPTAVFIANDLMAAGALKACQHKGIRVPEDISVLGFDDMDFSKYLIPSLSTIRKSRKNMGRLGAEMLLKILSTKTTLDIDYVKLQTELILRESTQTLK